MITRRGTLVLGGAFLALIAAVVINHLPLALMGTAGLAWVLAARLALRRTEIEAERSMQTETLYEGTDTTVTVEAAPVSGTQRLSVHQPTPQGLVLEGDNHREGLASPDDEIDLRFDVEAPVRGLYHFGPVEVRVLDPFGLIERVVEAEVGPMSLTVFPTQIRPQDVSGRPLYSYPRPGRFSSTKPGRGSEFYSIREYQPNDPLRLVNWKAAARYDELMVNEYEDERSTQSVALIDRRLATGFGPFAEAPIHEVTRSAVLVEEAARESGDSFLAVTLGKTPEVMKSTHSNAFKNRYQRMLAELEPEGDCSMAAGVNDILHQFKEGAKVVVCSPMLHDDDIDGIALLLARNCAVTVIVPEVPEPTNETERALVEQHEENVAAVRGLDVHVLEAPLGIVEHALGEGVEV